MRGDSDEAVSSLGTVGHSSVAIFGHHMTIRTSRTAPIYIISPIIISNYHTLLTTCNYSPKSYSQLHLLYTATL
jgi:hypothetical protein